MKTTPYVVQPGDYLLKLATRFGFDADTVWNLPDNKHLQDQKRDPHLLATGDVIYLPAPKRTWLPVTTGSDNAFTANVPLVALNLRMLLNGKACKGVAYTLDYGSGTATGSTKDDGSISVHVPVGVETAMLTLGDQPPIAVHLGHVDPIGTEAGLRHRLANLKYLHDSEVGAERGPGGLEVALRAFQTDSNIAVTGVADDATLAALLTAHGV